MCMVIISIYTANYVRGGSLGQYLVCFLKLPVKLSSLGVHCMHISKDIITLIKSGAILHLAAIGSSAASDNTNTDLKQFELFNCDVPRSQSGYFGIWYTFKNLQ